MTMVTLLLIFIGIYKHHREKFKTLNLFVFKMSLKKKSMCSRSYNKKPKLKELVKVKTLIGYGG